MMSTAPYGNYKDSGVEWLGAVPEHWEVKRLKYCAAQRGEKVNEVPADAKYLGMENIESGSGRVLLLEEQKAAEGACNIFKRGDVLFGKLRPYLAKATVAQEEGVCSTELLVLRPSNFDKQFLLYLMLSDEFIKVVDSSTYGAKMPRASWDFIGNLLQPFPPLAEQRAIASYLDRETARLDRLISRQERLTELSLEKRRALIGHAVTRGLDEAAPRQASGVEWLGDVPAHWEVWKLSHACPHIGSGTTPPSNEPEWYEGSTPWVTTGELRENVITETQKQVSDKALAQFPPLKKHPAGSVVMAMYGATIGRLGVLGVEATCNQACCVLAGSKVLAKEFLFYWLLRFREEIISLSVGGGQPNINQEIIARLKIALPSLSEQRAIVSYLDAETARLDRLMGRARRAVELMKERRGALIAAAVTGQMDVCGL